MNIRNTHTSFNRGSRTPFITKTDGAHPLFIVLLSKLSQVEPARQFGKESKMHISILISFGDWRAFCDRFASCIYNHMHITIINITKLGIYYLGTYRPSLTEQ